LRPQGLLPARKRRDEALTDETEEEAVARLGSVPATAGAAR
jgi:hypothetical protein